MNWRDKLAQARRTMNDRDQARDQATKVGNLRAGGTGIMDEAGRVAGYCTHEAHLRELGLVIDPPADEKLLMFGMGRMSEASKYSELSECLEPGQVLLREDECGIEWYTVNGKKVTGRPDSVICNSEWPGDGKSPPLPDYSNAIECSWNGNRILARPEEGFEFKGIASSYTSADILFERVPKLAHVCQAGHYAWKLGNIPYNLVYTQYSNQQLPAWKANQLPPIADELRNAGEWKSDGSLKQLVPFEVVYNLEIDDNGFIRFRCDGVDKGWTKTIVRTQDIERFFEYVSQMGEKKILGPEIMTMNAVGHEYKYSHCKQYCSAHRALGKYVKDYDRWLHEAKLLSQKLQPNVEHSEEAKKLSAQVLNGNTDTNSGGDGNNE